MPALWDWKKCCIINCAVAFQKSKFNLKSFEFGSLCLQSFLATYLSAELFEQRSTNLKCSQKTTPFTTVFQFSLKYVFSIFTVLITLGYSHSILYIEKVSVFFLGLFYHRSRGSVLHLFLVFGTLLSLLVLTIVWGFVFFFHFKVYER